MKMKNTTKFLSRLTVAATLLGACDPTHAGDVGHFAGGMMDTRDYFVPEPGFYGALYNYFYSTDRYNDQNGNRISTVTLSPGPGSGRTLDVEVDVDMYVLAPAFIWVSPWKVLGAKYGAYIAPTFADASIQSAVYNSRGLGGTGSTATFAPGDMFVQPLWLGWSLPHWDISTGYGFYAPVGKYSTETVTFPSVGLLPPSRSVTVPASDNIGLGYWTQQFQGAVAWYPWTNRATAVTAVLTYEYNSPQQGTDVKYGQNLWLTWGISQYLPLTKDQKLLLEVGPAGYYEWQISDTTGSLVQSPDARSQVSGIGGQLGVTYVPWNLILNFRGFYEYHAEERVQGASFSINLVKKF
jgi:hypothetical protein